MTFLTDTIFAYLAMSVFGTVGFLLTFNIVRAHRYDKLVWLPWQSLNSKNGAIDFAFIGIPFNVFYTIFLFAHPLPLGYLLAGLWIGFQIAFFYWYWHTKEDPLNRFHYEQKIWEDPRDKKKKEAK
jgi:hypothetical protein